MTIRQLGTRLLDASRDLIIWWIEELLGLLPPDLRGRMIRPDDRPTLLIAPQVMTLRTGAGAEDELIVWEQPVTAPGIVEATQLNEAVGERAVHVRFDRDLGLTRLVTMPVLSRRDLGNAVAFQVEQYFPFRAEDVYIAFGTGTASEGRLMVPVSVIERNILDTTVEALGNAGICAASYAVDAGDQVLRFQKSPAAPDRRLQQAWVAVAILSFVMVAVVTASWYGHREAYIRFLVEGIAERKTIALEAKRLSDKVIAAEEARGWLSAQSDRPDLGTILDGLASRVPATAWAEQLEWRGMQLRLQGYAADAVALPAQLGKGNFLQNIQFRSAMSGRGDTGKERFDLTAEIAGGN